MICLRMVLVGSDLGISSLQKALFSSVLLRQKGCSEEMLSPNYRLFLPADEFHLLVSLADPKRGRVEAELPAAKLNHQCTAQFCYKTQALLPMTTKPDTEPDEIRSFQTRQTDTEAPGPPRHMYKTSYDFVAQCNILHKE